MPVSYAERLSTIAPSATLAMAAKASQLSGSGVKVFPFSVGEPDFPTPDHVIKAGQLALARGATRYTAVTGTAALKSAIVSSMKRFRGVTIAADQIVVSCGAKHALFNVACALYEPGDEVIIPAPYWVSYPEQVRLFGATPVLVDTVPEDGFRLTPEALERAVTPRTKALILCTPSNPTGAAYDRDSLIALIEVIRRGNYFVVVDEIYADLTYGGFVHESLLKLAPDLASRLVIIDGVSKTFAMTGWRIGWSICHATLASKLGVIQGQSTTNPAAVAQEAAAEALVGPRDCVEAMRRAFEVRRNAMVGGLNALDGVTCRMPEGAFYAFADVRGLLGRVTPSGATLSTDLDVATWLLDTAHAATVAGTPFGAPGFVRFSYACSDSDIAEGLVAIRTAIANLR